MKMTLKCVSLHAAALSLVTAGTSFALDLRQDGPISEQRQARLLERFGEDGIDAASGEQPDLILMDVVMPGIDGFKATREITHNDTTSHIPVIILSSKSDDTDQIWAERQGARGYLTKPVNEKALISAISGVLKSKTSAGHHPSDG